MSDSQEIIELIEKSRQSLQAARHLLSGNFTDFAASRAYYAMFYMAEALLLRKGLAFSKHAGVIAAFGRVLAHPGEVPVEYHRYLLNAFEARQSGDYGDIGSVEAEEAAMHIQHAEELIAFGEKFLTSV